MTEKKLKKQNFMQIVFGNLSKSKVSIIQCNVSHLDMTIYTCIHSSYVFNCEIHDTNLILLKKCRNKHIFAKDALK